MAGRLRRFLAPLAFCAGLFLFGVALVGIGIEALPEHPTQLEPGALLQGNGTASLAYPTKYFGLRSERVDVAYSFPEGVGDVYVLDCQGYGALRRGEDATPLMAFEGLREGTFSLSYQTMPAEALYVLVVDPETGLRAYCEAVVVFEWPAAGGDPGPGRPTATVTHHVIPFDQGQSWLLLMLLTASSLLALLGGLSWAGARRGPAPPPADTGPLEVLRASLDRMGEQLRRTRQLLVFAGVLGVFVWYPVLVPWAWRQAARTGVSPVFPWAVAGLTLAFLIALTALWARELHRLDRELLAWRTRMDQLRDRESGMLDTLEQGR